MRGAPLPPGEEPGLPWIIPADAGSTTCVSRLQLLDEDHPRGCGEHQRWIVGMPTREGSSPRMRGALMRRSDTRGHRRIIPADAGSTLAWGRPWTSTGDHPRGCGEHPKTGAVSYERDGSSPRMRGARTFRNLPAKCAGIIPADAGSTDNFPTLTIVNKDHPRGCGEHCICLSAIVDTEGSSPRMRGAHL